MTPITVALMQTELTKVLNNAAARFDEKLAGLIAEGYTLGATVQFMGEKDRTKIVIQAHGAARDTKSPVMIFLETRIATDIATGKVTAIERPCEEPLTALHSRYPKPRFTSMAAPYDLAEALASYEARKKGEK